jgi:hypothetical protein
MKSVTGWGTVGLVLVGIVFGCATSRSTRKYLPPPPPDLEPTVIDYVDTDGFDALLESSLRNQDPVILIQTDRTKPDWQGRLNAWIAAWNMGGKVEGPAGAGSIRGQSPVTVDLDGDNIRELRLLVESLMGGIEAAAVNGAAWWANERMRKLRVDLLLPYNLRFHMAENGTIQIILFNGNYARYHDDFVRDMAHPDDENGEEWVRGVHCSRCKNWQAPPGDGPKAGLTSREREP